MPESATPLVSHVIQDRPIKRSRVCSPGTNTESFDLAVDLLNNDDQLPVYLKTVLGHVVERISSMELLLKKNYELEERLKAEIAEKNKLKDEIEVMVIEFNDLPPELVIAIVSRLNYGDMCNCLTLNKKTRAIINTNLHLIPRMWITNISLVREEKSCFKLSVSRNSFKSPKKNWLCSLKENTNAAKKTRPCYDITDFYNNEGFCGMKWDKANKSTEFVVSSIQNSLEEHLSFVLQKANVLCLKLVDLEGVDMEVVTNVLRLSKARVSHLQLVINRTMSSEIVSVIDATGAETIDIVMSDVNFFRNLPFRSSVFRKAWSVTIRTSLMDASDMLDITDADLLSLTADSIEFFGTTSITAEGARRLVQEWVEGRRKISLVYFRHTGDYDSSELLNGIPYKNGSPIVVTRRDGEELRITWDSSKFRCFTDEADDEGDDEFPDQL